MIERLKSFRWLLLIAAVCTLAAAWLVAWRIGIERTQKQVDLIFSYEDLCVLAEESDIPVEDWLRALGSAGLHEIILNPNQLDDERILSQISDAGMGVAQLGGLARGGTYLFAAQYEPQTQVGISFMPPMRDDPLDAETVFNSILHSDSLLAAVDDCFQTGLILPNGFYHSFSEYKGDVAKCFRLCLELSRRYRTLGYEGYEEIENILFRAVVDRGMTVLWLTPMSTPDGVMITDPAEYAGLIRSLSSRIARAGYQYGSAVGIPFYETQNPLLLICGVGVISAAVLLPALILPLQKRRLIGILFGLGMAQNLLFSVFFMQTQITLLALLSAIVFPCLSIVFLTILQSTAAWSKRPLLLRFPAVLLSTFLVTLWGCVYIAGMMSSSHYLIVLRMFRGVKLSQFSVYLFAIVLPAVCILHQNGSSLQGDLRRLAARIDRRSLRKALLVLLLLGLVGTVYLLRTGDGILKASAAEQRVRNFLENTLLYRPRTKEILLAWPAIAAALFFAERKSTLLSWLFHVLGGIGFASVANTFCHSRAHFIVSIYRSFLGLGIGMVLGILVLLLLLLFDAVIKSMHKRKPLAS